MRHREESLEEVLFECPFEFDFFQAVRLLHLLQSERPAVGGVAHPHAEPVRFKVRQSLEFQASAIHALTAETDPPQMTVAFMGLTGVQGVLPLHYTEHILARAAVKDARAKDFAMAEFFDLFNHRLLSLFYRAWEKHRFPVRYQLAAARTQTDDLTAYLFDVIGLGTAGLRDRMTVPDHALLRYAGLFAQRPRCVSSLRAILHDYFGVPVEIQEFIGAWHQLKPENKADLESADLNNCLGLGAIAGDMIWDPQGRFRVQLGPLKLDQFAAFLPGQEATTKLHDLVRFYVGPVLDFEIQLILQANDEVDQAGKTLSQGVPWPVLGGDSEVALRLGWSAWLKTEPFEQPARDALFRTCGPDLYPRLQP